MIIKKIQKVVKENPNKIAYKVNNETITYQELWSSVEKYAQSLKRQGTSPVVIYGHKEINVVKSILSCLLANRTYVPVGSCTPISRLEKIVEMTKSTLVLTDEKISIDNVCCTRIDDLDKFANLKENEIDNNIAYIIFTSGSTGVPKGVPISKDNLDNFVNWMNSLKPLCDYKDISVLNQASFSFDLSVADFYYSMCNGDTLIALNGDVQEDFDEIFSIMHEVTVAVMTPTLMKICLLNKDFNETNYPNFKCVYFCGEMLENKTVKKIFDSFPNLEIINAYGPTEATSAVSGIIITKEIVNNEELLPVGDTSNLATKVEIIDDEIVLKGPSVFNGYLGNITGGYYKENGINCYKTGDIGFIKNNKLYCKGRKDSQIKYKGYRIELNDIEHNISKIKGVKECAVVAKYNEDNVVKSVKAFVVGDVTTGFIKEELDNMIPGYMMPRTIKIIDKMPVNQNGKVDRKALSNL